MKKIFSCLLVVLLMASFTSCLPEYRDKLPEDEIFESQVMKEGMTESVTKVRHYSKLGFILEYPENLERFYSDNSILFKWYYSTLTITKYAGRNMESVKKEIMEDFNNLSEKSTEIAGKSVLSVYNTYGDIYMEHCLFEDGDAIYVARICLPLEALEGIGVDFYDILKSISFY